MVQYQKEELRTRILNVSQKEFLNVGFEKTSIRSIAKIAGMTKSNIYTYFKSKDDIFCEVVSPTVRLIDHSLHFVDNPEAFDSVLAKMDNHHELVPMIADFIEDNRNNLHLLLLKSAGTSLEGYKDRFIKSHNEVALRMLPRHAVSLNVEKVNVSEFFIHFATSAFVKFVEEIIRFNVSHTDIIEYTKEYLTYHVSGHKALLMAESE